METCTALLTEATMWQCEEVPKNISVPVPVPVPVKYGELVVLGYNGLLLPNGGGPGTQSHFALCQRPEANGVKPGTIHTSSNPQAAKAVSAGDQHRITFITAVTTVVVEHSSDEHTDMFQIGRSRECDFVVTDTVPVSGDSLISRFACRIICQRRPPYTAHIYAAGFDSSKNISLGEKAVKWKSPDGQMDGLTTSGVLVMRPLQGFTPDSTPGPWREISVRGHAFALRKTRTSPKRGERVDGEPQELTDGSLIDLCGVTLLWRTADGLPRTPAREALRRPKLNAAGRPWCPLVFNDLPFHRLSGDEPCWANLRCGHFRNEDYHHGHGEAEVKVRPDRIVWNRSALICAVVKKRKSAGVECPTCRVRGRCVPLQLGCEEAFFLDDKRGRHAFVPCGHVCSEATAAFWSRMPLPGDAATFPATSPPACPFCAQRLTKDTGYVKLHRPLENFVNLIDSLKLDY